MAPSLAVNALVVVDDQEAALAGEPQHDIARVLGRIDALGGEEIDLK